jgi:hypothetical protein
MERQPLTLLEIINQLELAMISERISHLTAKRVVNRIIYGHPDGLNARIDLGLKED